MAEYLYPGVYVEEIAFVAKPIEGVSTSIDNALLQSLVAELRQTIPIYLPEWTTVNESDPGVALLQLFAFLADALGSRGEKLPDSGRIWAFRAAARLLELAGSPAAAGASPKRPSYFSGQLLDVATLQAEQDYFREKMRLHNRQLHGFGIVSGLGVSVSSPEDQGGSRIIVEPGYAIDPRGEEIALPAGATLALPAGGDEAFVTLRFWEHPCPEPSTSEGENPCFPCVEEVCVIGVSREIPPSAFAIARLLRLDNYWIVDAEFVAPRVP
jgi:hypothetical protein